MSAANLSRVSTHEPPAAAPAGHRAPWRDAAEGLRTVLTNRYLRPLLGEATTFNVANEIFVLGLLLYTVRELGMSPAQLGLVFTAGGAGSFLGAWFGARVTGRFGYGRVLVITLAFGNTAPAAVVFARNTATAALPVLLSAFFVMGVGIGIANVHAVSLRQTVVPDHVQGRVNAGYRLISWGALPVGAGLGGALASAPWEATPRCSSAPSPSHSPRCGSPCPRYTALPPSTTRRPRRRTCHDPAVPHRDPAGRRVPRANDGQMIKGRLSDDREPALDLLLRGSADPRQTDRQIIRYGQSSPQGGSSWMSPQTRHVSWTG